jgi:teichuronic acid biosynthesis glycosyltransferase TuaG
MPQTKVTPVKPSLVSVIMAVYNGEAFIEEAIRSVMAQTYPHWELMVVDDCSRDGTARIVSKLAKEDPRIKLIRRKVNGGLAEARNHGIAESQGRFIALLDSDDIWLPQKLAVQVPLLENNAEAICTSSYGLMRHDGTRLDKVRYVSDTTYGYRHIVFHNVIGVPTVLIDTKKTGPIRFPKLRLTEDLALWLQLLAQGHTVRGCSQTLALYRFTNGSLSSNKLKAARGVWNVLRHVHGLPLGKAAACFVLYAIVKFPRLFERI